MLVIITGASCSGKSTFEKKLTSSLLYGSYESIVVNTTRDLRLDDTATINAPKLEILEMDFNIKGVNGEYYGFNIPLLARDYVVSIIDIKQANRLRNLIYASKYPLGVKIVHIDATVDDIKDCMRERGLSENDEEYINRLKQVLGIKSKIKNYDVLKVPRNEYGLETIKNMSDGVEDLDASFVVSEELFYSKVRTIYNNAYSLCKARNEQVSFSMESLRVWCNNNGLRYLLGVYYSSGKDLNLNPSIYRVFDKTYKLSHMTISNTRKTRRFRGEDFRRRESLVVSAIKYHKHKNEKLEFAYINTVALYKDTGMSVRVFNPPKKNEEKNVTFIRTYETLESVCRKLRYHITRKGELMGGFNEAETLLLFPKALLSDLDIKDTKSC